MNADWALGHVRLKAEVMLPNGNSLSLPVVACQTNFALNSIPDCQLQLAMGRETYGGGVSAVHSHVNELRRMLPVKVWAEVSRRTASTPGLSRLRWPDTPFSLFEGYTVGMGIDRDVNGTATATLGCTHWLSDLAFSSAVSRTSAPSNPSDLSFGGSYRAGKSSAASFFTWGTPSSYVTGTNISTDFWGKALYPLFAFLCADDRFQLVAEKLLPALEPGEKGNFEALRALRRFEGSGVAYKYSQPVKMDPKQVGIAEVASSMARGILSPTPDSLAVTTLWDHLTGDILPNLLLSLVPMVDRALIVPFVPGLRSTWTRLLGNELGALKQSQRNPRPLRGFGIMTAVTGPSGGFLPADGRPPGGVAVSAIGVGGYWQNPDPSTARGMVHFKAAPPWLAAMQAPPPPAGLVTPPDGVRGAAGAPGAGVRPPDILTPAQALKRVRTLSNEFARAMYCYEILRGRSGVVASAFRMDLAPGSTVEIEAVEDVFVQAELKKAGLPLSGPLYATVSRVSQTLSSEQSSAATLLQLDHLRTSQENTSDSVSTTRHPIWNNVWTGAPLLDNAAFDRSTG
jgi:hypothetical protein